MAKRRREGGLTLIEILLALLVMVLGLLGILALFPQALQSSRESVEETYGAVLAESVAHSVKTAIQFGKYEPTTSYWTCVMAHDLKSANAVVRFTFALPKLADNWKHFPSGSGGGATADQGMPPTPSGPGVTGPEQDPHFNLGGDQWIYAVVDNVWKVNDPTDPYTQFAFSFDLRKINTMDYLLRPVPQINPATGAVYTEADLEPITKLYELRVNVFRTATQLGAGGGAATTRKILITQVNYRIGTK